MIRSQLESEREAVEKWGKKMLGRTRVRSYPYQDARKLARPYPAVRYTYPDVPDSVREVKVE
ncbi:hypothetical protein [Streptomyces sp. URMC 129]|uniref:hypothetical protein n=1 Tax=Streptomyces sp. URMC 129 TaxID=3423407 RepID=UPI003F199180